MRFRTCKECGASGKEVYVSGSRRCLKCSMKKLKKINKQLKDKKGYYFQKWKKGILASLKKRKA